MVTALYAFEPQVGLSRYRTQQTFSHPTQEPGELRFNKGDQIQVLDSSDPNWWKGMCRGEQGLFPSTYAK